MTDLPDRSRPPLDLLARWWRRELLKAAAGATWRVLHPRRREAFVEAPRPTRLSRVEVQTADGWSFPLHELPPRPGGAGEPVMLVSGLSMSPDAFRYGSTSLARSLSDAGFTVLLASHRGDADAVPSDPRAAVRPGGVVAHNLPAALDAAARFTGAARVHLVGHSLGAVLAMAMADDPRVASVTALGAPVCLPPARSELRRTAMAMSWLPSRIAVPARVLARLATPWSDEVPGAAASPGPRARGALCYAAEDAPLGFLQEILEWIDEGRASPGGRDLLALVGRAKSPLLAIAGSEDTVCPPDATRPAVDAWHHPDKELLVVDGYGHLDLLFGADAPARVFAPVVQWLEARRRRSWDDVQASAA